MNELEQQLIDELPAQGEMPFVDLRRALIVADKRDVLSRFHDMRRAGKVAVRLDGTDLYVSRVGSQPPPAAT